MGDDIVTGERKYRDEFSFYNFAKLLFSCNSLPKNVSDKSEGFYRRLVLIGFSRSIPEDKRDPFLLDKFRDEVNGILRFALEGLIRLIENNFVFSTTQINDAMLQTYREDSDSVLAFVRDRCEFGSGFSVGSTELYNVYKSYCEECGLKPYAHSKMISQIKVAYPNVTNGVDTTGKRRILNGIKVGVVLG